LDRVVVVHCDLGRVEWRGTRELAEEQAAHFGVRFEVVSRSQDLLDQVEQRGMWPSSKARYCTSDHKRAQVDKLMTKLTAELRHLRRPVRILNCQGIRAEESTERSKKTPFQLDMRASNTKRHVDLWYPIFTWTLEQVWDRIRASGIRHHFAYDLGMPRLSCAFCVFAGKQALILAGHHNTALLDQYCDVEIKTGHKFRQDVSLVQIREAVRTGQSSGPVESWSM
jgi:3'-phosphoadenosine 5'-phosphosulfate sulfotransferase (PAPS reductase)/FAD synthetase